MQRKEEKEKVNLLIEKIRKRLASRQKYITKWAIIKSLNDIMNVYREKYDHAVAVKKAKLRRIFVMLRFKFIQKYKIRKFGSSFKSRTSKLIRHSFISFDNCF